MDPLHIISKYYHAESLAYRCLVIHSESVTQMAVAKAVKMNLSNFEVGFIQEAAMLHDIGIFYTKAIEIGCDGDLPYICHGYKGHNLLLEEGLPRHALVCERHTGTGLTLSEIEKMGGLLPLRPMEPISLAEKLIAYCDKFFSKDPRYLNEMKPFEMVLDNINKYGVEKGQIFTEWHRQFNQ